MEKQTVIGIFDSAADARQAVSNLQSAGFPDASCDIASRPSADGDGRSNTSYNTDSGNRSDSNYYNKSGTAVEGAADAVGRGAEKSTSAIGRFFDDLFGTNKDESDRYTHVAERSESIVTVHCNSSEEAHRAAELLDDAGAVDVNERAAQYGYGNENATAGKEDGQTLKVMREDVQVGKREVETGGARVRARVVERPVEENVRLREEHVFVDRQRVDRPATSADFETFKEGTIEMRERAEVPVVNKEARVVEEVRLGKEATERTETVRETARNTEVDVERLGGDATSRAMDRDTTSGFDNNSGSSTSNR